MDPVTISLITAGLTGAGHLTGAFKNISETIKNLREGQKDPAMKAALGDLTVKVADAMLEIADLKEKLAAAKTALAEQAAKDDLVSKRVLREKAYFITSPPPGVAEGPYCTTCWDSSGKTILLLEPDSMDRQMFSKPGRKCGVCKARYN